MKVQSRPLRMGDLLDGRRRSPFDLTPAIDRLTLELQHAEILEEAKREDGRIFPIVTKAFLPTQRVEIQPDGSIAPIRVVRFPTPVEDREEWAKQCQTWQRKPLTIALPDEEDDPSTGSLMGRRSLAAENGRLSEPGAETRMTSPISSFWRKKSMSSETAVTHTGYGSPKPPRRLHWEPQPGPQEMLLACPVEDIGFGGARGGGKTAGMFGDFLFHENQYGKHARGLLLRRTYPELDEVIRQADALLLGWKKNVEGPTYRAPSGGILSLRALQRDGDADKFHGHSYTWIGVDEATHWSRPEPLDKLRACLRSTHPGIRKRFILTANPGGVGHNWFKARYLDPAPPCTPFYDSASLTWRVYIPSRLEDNPKLITNDPQYWQRVIAAANGREDLIKAWRYGRWDIVAGGMFDDLWQPDCHVISPFPIPSLWHCDRAFDWGSSRPFSVGWWAESNGTRAPNGKTYPRGTLFRFAEWYGWNGYPNQGLKMLAVDIAKTIREKERLLRETGRVSQSIAPGPADSAIFDVANGMSIADDMARQGIQWEPADKSPGSRKTGAEKLRARLAASRQTPMEEPGIFIFEDCRQWIRCVPVLPRDPRDTDDVDSSAEDHNYDETRYRLLHQTTITIF